MMLLKVQLYNFPWLLIWAVYSDDLLGAIHFYFYSRKHTCFVIFYLIHFLCLLPFPQGIIWALYCLDNFLFNLGSVACNLLVVNNKTYSYALSLAIEDASITLQLLKCSFWYCLFLLGWLICSWCVWTDKLLKTSIHRFQMHSQR